MRRPFKNIKEFYRLQNQVLEAAPKLSSFRKLPQVSIVRFIKDTDISGYQDAYPEMKITDRFILIGEILQCHGHVVMQNIRGGNFYTMIHTDDLEMVPFEEC